MSQSEDGETYGRSELWKMTRYPGFGYNASLLPIPTTESQRCQPRASSDNHPRTIPLLGAPPLEQAGASTGPRLKPAFAWIEAIRSLLQRQSITQPITPCEPPRRTVPRPAQSVSGICNLPAEILLHIMRYLSPEWLYALRQASRLFTQLMEDREFNQYLRPHCAGDNFLRFATSCLSIEQGDCLAKALWRDMLCRSCHETRDGNGWERRLEHLREQLYCQGCKDLHPRFLFFPQDVHDSELGLRELECVGRRGRAQICAHLMAPSHLWHEVELSEYLDPYRRLFDCRSHSVHQPSPAIEISKMLSPFPRQEIQATGGQFHIKSACDTPLLDIAKDSTLALAIVQESLIVSISKGLENTSVCRHLQRRGRLPGFVRSGICECFAKAQGDICPFPPVALSNCLCCRERYLTCADCGAVCAWSLEAGRVYLSYRYDWSPATPTSPQWLLFLNEDSYVTQLFREESKHVLWYDDGKCVLKYRRRWYFMIKEDIIQRCKQLEEGPATTIGTTSLPVSIKVAGELSKKTSYLLPQYSTLKQYDF